MKASREHDRQTQRSTWKPAQALGQDAPTKFFQEKGLSSCFQDCGQAMSTVLCLMPPRPADWIRWDMPSRRVQDTTSWQKPFIFSMLIKDRMF